MTRTIVTVGLDPGLDGAVAVLVDGAPYLVEVWPTVELCKASGGVKREYDEVQVLDLVRRATSFPLASAGKAVVVRAFLERQQSMPRQGVSSTFSTGLGYGMLRMALVALRARWELVPAKAWQKVMLAGLPRAAEGQKGSAQGYLVCQRLWPEQSLLATPRCRSPHDGICDALLIAEYGRRVVSGGG